MCLCHIRYNLVLVLMHVFDCFQLPNISNEMRLLENVQSQDLSSNVNEVNTEQNGYNWI